MSLKEDRSYLQSLKAERESLQEDAKRRDIEEFNNSIIERENIKAMHEAKVDKFYRYKDDVKKTLVYRALYGIYEGSIFSPSDREKAICKNLLEEYISEAGVANLLKNMRFSENSLLRTIYEETNDYFDKITDGAELDDDSTQTIKSDDVESFWKEIDKNEDVEDVTNLIRLRVSNAEEEFVNKNHEDKEDIKTILNQTSKRVQLAKQSNDNDYSDMVEESESRIAKDRIYSIQHESHHNVFDRMVRNLSEAVIHNEDAKTEFINENGRLNMDKIVESARCMFTLLEMVSTIQLEKVDQKYIEETLKSIK